MKVIRRMWLVVMVVATLVACGPKAIDTQSRTATAIAVGVNGVTPLLREMEQKEGDDAIDRAPDKAMAKLWVLAVQDRWKPVWTAHKALQIAQDTWATTLEKGGDTQAAYAALQVAFCKFVPLLPKSISVTPIAGVICQGAVNYGARDGSTDG